jgi:hypothetical protein
VTAGGETAALERADVDGAALTDATEQAPKVKAKATHERLRDFIVV